MCPTLTALRKDQFAKNPLELERRRAEKVARRITALKSCVKKRVKMGNIVLEKVFAKMVILCLVFVPGNSISVDFQLLVEQIQTAPPFLTEVSASRMRMEKRLVRSLQIQSVPAKNMNFAHQKINVQFQVKSWPKWF